MTDNDPFLTDNWQNLPSCDPGLSLTITWGINLQKFQNFYIQTQHYALKTVIKSKIDEENYKWAFRKQKMVFSSQLRK